jgi:hypothetical protein
MACNYIEKYESLSEALFSQMYQSIQNICVKFNDAVQTPKQASTEHETTSTPLAQEGSGLLPKEEEIFFSPEPEEFSGISTRKAFLDAIKNKETKKELENHNPIEIQQPFLQENIIQSQAQELPAEVQLEPTAWQNAKDWFWWFNDGIESLWGRTWRYFQGKNN